MITRFAILKAYSPHAGGGDAEWYAGTQDHIPVWGKEAALFLTEEQAKTRMDSLQKVSQRELKVSQLLIKEDELHTRNQVLV